MLKNIQRVLLLLMIVLSGNLVAGPFLTNGSFEADTNQDGWPDDWGKGKHLSWQKEADSHFLRISAVPGKMALVYRLVKVPAEAKALELSFRARCTDLKIGKKKWFDARIMMNFKDAAGKKLGGAPSPYFRKDTKGWVDKKVDFLVPEGAVSLELMPCLFNAKSGVFDLDDLALKVVPPEPIVARIKAQKEAKEREIARRAALVKPQVPVPSQDQLPPALKVVGNQIQTKDGKQVWLQGLCIDSMEWCAGGERILASVREAIKWKVNCIRLPIKEDFYGGTGPWQNDGGAGYRQLVEDVVNLSAANGIYVVIDLHRFRAPKQKHADFWEVVAKKYKDHPAVLFELFNEPHDVSWEVWKDGGFVSDKKGKTTVVAENNQKLKGFHSIGMQALVRAVRKTGAKNIVIVGGVDWSYDISGIMRGYALDDLGGNGIVYSTHVYPWKKNWQKFTVTAKKHPIFIGEVGNLRKWEDFSFIGPKQRYEPVGPKSAWPGDMIGLIQKHRLNWTAFSFHPKCGPCVISDWDYTPTPYWGVFVKRALAGEKFELKKLR